MRAKILLLAGTCLLAAAPRSVMKMAPKVWQAALASGGRQNADQ